MQRASLRLVWLLYLVSQVRILIEYCIVNIVIFRTILMQAPSKYKFLYLSLSCLICYIAKSSWLIEVFLNHILIVKFLTFGKIGITNSFAIKSRIHFSPIEAQAFRTVPFLFISSLYNPYNWLAMEFLSRQTIYAFNWPAEGRILQGKLMKR